MATPSLEDLDARIAIVRDNIRELIEQAAAFSGAQDEALGADRIAEQERSLAELCLLKAHHSSPCEEFSEKG